MRALLWFWSLLPLVRLVRAGDGAAAAAVSPQDCSLDCIQQGGPGCEYCRITTGDIKEALGFRPIGPFGSCVPWPCFDLLGTDDPKICQHYVHAPNDVKVEFVHEPNPESDTVFVSWRPSHYGIAFLRGFQVSLQALGGSATACQLLLFHRNVSLSASHAQTVYKSDPFPGLPLGSQYAVTVMALPVPEQWERFYHSKIFSTRSCAEKNGLEQCKRDWYPQHVEVQQEGTSVTVTFNLAPPNLGITSYFSLCAGSGRKKYMDITPNSSENKTHHSYQLCDLQEGTNYTCEIAANEIDAVRKTFNIRLVHIQRDQPSVTPSLTLLLPLCLAVAAIFAVLLAALSRWGPGFHVRKLFIKPALTSPSPPQFDVQHGQEGSATANVEAAAAALPSRKMTVPPRLLICYSSRDGPAHVKAVMQLGAFIQQHMATQVLLDVWDSLSVAREGAMSWYCRQIRECDFILVVCSRGLSRGLAPPTGRDEEEDEDAGGRGQDFVPSSACDAAVRLIGEEVGRAKARGRDLSKYMAAIFQHSEEDDVPAELRLVPQYELMCDLPLLFSHLHAVALHQPGGYLKINHISDDGFAQLPAGAALQLAVYEAGVELRAKCHGGN